MDTRAPDEPKWHTAVPAPPPFAHVAVTDTVPYAGGLSACTWASAAQNRPFFPVTRPRPAPFTVTEVVLADTVPAART